MKKYWKRVLAAVLALTMLCALSACGKKDAGDSGDGAASYHIGYHTWGSGTPVFEFMSSVVANTLDAAGATYARANDENTADKQLQNIQNFISAHVDGIVMMPAASSILPEAAKDCEESETPFVLSVFIGEDSDRAEIRANNKYYLGSVSADMYTEGYNLGKSALENGHKTAVLIGGNVGDANIDIRINGFTQSFVTEGGGTILDIARCSSPAEGQEKANAMLSAYPDADCLYSVAGDYLPGSVSAMETLGLSIPVYLSNADKDAIEYIRNGTIETAVAGCDLVCAVASALLINYLDGHQILDDEGLPPELQLVAFPLNKDNVDDFETYFYGEDTFVFTEARLQTLMWRFNPDVSYATFVDFIENCVNLDTIAADHQG